MFKIGQLVLLTDLKEENVVGLLTGVSPDKQKDGKLDFLWHVFTGGEIVFIIEDGLMPIGILDNN